MFNDAALMEKTISEVVNSDLFKQLTTDTEELSEEEKLEMWEGYSLEDVYGC